MMDLLTAMLIPSDNTRRFFGVLLGGLLLIGIFIAMMPSNHVDTGLEVSDKILHAIAFFGFAALLDIASRKDFWQWQTPLLLGYGALIEVLQSLVSWRTFSLLDLIADAVGIILYSLLAIYWLKPYMLTKANQPVAQ